MGRAIGRVREGAARGRNRRVRRAGAGRRRRGGRPAPRAPAAGPGDRGQPGRAGRVGQGTHRDRVLPAAAAGQLRRARGGPDRVLHRGAADRERVRVDRLGGVRARRPPVAARPVPGPGAGGGLGRRPGHPDVFLLRADRAGARRRRRVPADGPVELLLRRRARDLGAARRDRARATTASPSTSARSCCRPATTPSTTCGTRSGCAARAATTSWWTAPSSPRTGRSASTTSPGAPAPARSATPGRCTGSRTGRCSPTPSRRRSSAWRPGRTRRTWPTSATGYAPRTRGRRPATTRSARCRWPRRRA